MDKKNTIIGISLLLIAFTVMSWNSAQTEKAKQEFARQQALQQAEAAANADSAAPLANPNSLNSLRGPALEADFTPSEEEEIKILEGDYVRITFTNLGGAIKSVALKKYPKVLESPEPYLVNRDTPLTALALTLGSSTDARQALTQGFALTSQTKKSLSYATNLSNGLTIERTFAIKKDQDETIDPYVIKGEVTLRNTTEQALPLGAVYLGLGVMPPEAADTRGEYMNFGYYNGQETEFLNLKEFVGGSGFLGIGASDPQAYIARGQSPTPWASVKNQFFAAVLTPGIPADGILAQSVNLQEKTPSPTPEKAITGSLRFDRTVLAAGESFTIPFSYYVGPKEFSRLEQLGELNQDEVMQFGFFAWASKPLLKLMGWLHGLVGNWGLSIILLTVIIKLCFWPLTSKGIRSQKITAKKMSFLQEPMKQIREKYKGEKSNPQKMQQEMMELYRNNDANPAGAVLGCIPLLIQMPIFFALFAMLRTASELRFAEFLWVQDLSQPDQLFHIGGFPINALPLIMTLTTYLQMRMTPTPNTGDEQQIMMQKMMRFMPFIFLIMLYGFASGLALYWTSNNVLTIIQTYLINRKVEPELKRIEKEYEEKKAKEKKKNPLIKKKSK